MLPAEELERVACLLLALGGQLVEQELFERLWGEMALEHAGDRHRDRARLLGDDDDDGIGDLADADARAALRARLQNDPNRLLALPYKLGLALRAPGLLAAYTLAKQRFL